MKLANCLYLLNPKNLTYSYLKGLSEVLHDIPAQQQKTDTTEKV